MRPAEGSANIGERMGKYDVIREVGRGSTGTVYLSHDSYYGRDIAIKAYRIAADDDPARAKVARKMFLSEAHMVGMLQHPNIMPIYDAGEESGYYYVVTEFIHGARTLSAYTRPDNLLPVEDVLTLMFKCAKALHYAHSRGVIHRDIKPSNLMLTTDSDLRLIDFGIALHNDADFSRIEGIAGSPSYMSPEQVQSLELTNHSDLYSLGAVMYELLTGHRPFRAGALAKLLHQIVYATPPPMLSIRPDLPTELEAVVATAMHKEPDKRYPNGAEFANAIARVHAQQRKDTDRSDRQEHFNLLRRLKFFHDFSSDEIWEVLRAGTWQRARAGRRDRPRGRHRRPFLRDRDRRLPGRPRRRGGRQARGGRLLRRDQLPARRKAPGRGGRRRGRHHPARQLDAARAGLVGLPAALQQGVPQGAHLAPAERRVPRRQLAEQSCSVTRRARSLAAPESRSPPSLAQAWQL